MKESIPFSWRYNKDRRGRAVNSKSYSVPSLTEVFPPPTKQNKINQDLALVETVFYHKEFIFDNRMFLLFSSLVISTTGFQGSEMKWEQQGDINF